MQSSDRRDELDALNALNHMLWSFFFQNGYRMVWESRNPTRTCVLDASWRTGTWKELARIDTLRGHIDDDMANTWWERLYDSVPACKRLSPEVSSRNSKGNVVEACVGASFVASHELQQRRFHFRTEPPDALAHAAAIFARFAACGVSNPPPIFRVNYAGIPALIEGFGLAAAAEPKAVSASATQAASASATQAASASATQAPASLTVYYSDYRGHPPPPHVDAEPRPWPELVGTIKQSSSTGPLFIHSQ